MDPGAMDYKGSEKLLEAFEAFILNNPGRKVRMISGLHGRDTEKFKKMVFQMGLGDYIDYIDHLSLPDLHSYLALDNVVVFDQFTNNLNALGGIQREALSFGKLVISSTDIRTNEFIKTYGDSCPVVPAFNREQILESMIEISAMNKKAYEERSRQIRKWAEQHIHWENRIDEFSEILKSTYYTA